MSKDSTREKALKDTWWKDRVFYEIFPRSFQDLKGIASRLDYLRSLGVGGIWLTPIFQSPSDHGYDATDYRAVHPALGSLDDFKFLLSEAHQKDIKLIIDMAINHTSIQHPWFKNNPEMYCWREEDPGWQTKGKWYPDGGRYYWAVFDSKMPDLDWKNPRVMEEIKGIFHFWASLGVDGFRLDAARYLVEGPAGETDTPETHEVLRELVRDVKSKYPDILFVGEVWADAKTILPYLAKPDGMDLAFHFPASDGILRSLQEGYSSHFNEALEGAKEASDRFAPFLTNHDLPRIATQVGNDRAKLKLAAAALMTLPGVPFIYYGEELGMLNSDAPSDQAQRGPMPWHLVDEQQGSPDSLLSAYQTLIRIRNREPALRDPTTEVIPTPNPSVSVYRRGTGPGFAVVILNFGKSAAKEILIPLPPNQTESPLSLGVLWGSVQPELKNDASFQMKIPELGPCEAAIIRVSGSPVGVALGESVGDFSPKPVD